MIIYKDIITGDEIISDSWKMKEIDDAVYEVDCQMVTSGNEKIDIGANPSAEEAEEGLDDTTKKEIDVVKAFQLKFLGDEASGTRLFATQKDYLSQLKTYLKNVKEKLGTDTEKIQAFEKGVNNYYKNHIKKNFSNFDFYIGASMNVETGMIVLLNYREDGITPYVTIWKYGLEEMKV